MTCMNNMKTLLENDFIATYGIKSEVSVAALQIKEIEFDLDDDLDSIPSPIQLKALGDGKVSFHNEKGEIEIVHYEDFIDQCKKPRSFLNGRKKCDYLMTHTDKRGTAMLVEITSAHGTKENLSKPIPRRNKAKSILFEGGKYEKCEEQLWQSLSDLKIVPSIAHKLDSYAHKICLMAYEVKPNTEKQAEPKEAIIRRPFNRYLKEESRSTSEDGAIVPCPKIEVLGFEYRRIEHGYVFQL